MDLKILLQQYVNLLTVYQYAVDNGKYGNGSMDINFLFQEKNIAYEEFIERIFRADIEEMVNLKEFIDNEIRERDNSDPITYRHINIKKNIYININTALADIIAERKVKKL